MNTSYGISIAISKESNFESKREVAKEYIDNDFIYLNY